MKRAVHAPTNTHRGAKPSITDLDKSHGGTGKHFYILNVTLRNMYSGRRVTPEKHAVSIGHRIIC